MPLLWRAPVRMTFQTMLLCWHLHACFSRPTTGHQLWPLAQALLLQSRQRQAVALAVLQEAVEILHCLHQRRLHRPLLGKGLVPATMILMLGQRMGQEGLLWLV